METEALRWLTEVADGDTVAAVARRQHISQPAVTRGLARLSAQVGVALTERAGRRLQLTFAGERVVESARRALTDLDGALRAVAEADDPESGTVRLGFLAPLGTWPVPELITEFRQVHPGVAFSLRHDGAMRIGEALRDGTLDLLLTEPAPGVDGGGAVDFRALFEQELLLALPAGHALAQRSRIRIAELADEAWVVQPEGHGLRRQLEELCAAAGFAPRVAFESADLATLYALVGADNGIGLFAARPQALAAGVARVALSPPARRTVGLMSRRGGTIPAAAREFARFATARLAAVR